MKVITFANSKGGAGKTTASLVTACILSQRGFRVAVLDLAPKGHIVRWYADRKTMKDIFKNKPFDVYQRPDDANDLIDFIEQIEEDYDYAVLDLEGVRDQMVTLAVTQSDLVIIPMNGDSMEADDAGETVRLVRSMSKATSHNIPHSILFTKVSGIIPGEDEISFREDAKAHGIDILPVRLVNRAPFKRIYRLRCTFKELLAVFWASIEEQGKTRTNREKQKDREQLEKAVNNADDLVDCIIERLFPANTTSVPVKEEVTA